MTGSLIVVYPRPGHTTHEHSTFIIGSAPPGGSVVCQGRTVPTTPEGYFSQIVPLTQGKQTLTVSSRQVGHPPQTLQIPVTVVPPFPVLQGGQPLFHRETVFPAWDLPLVLAAGSALTLSWSGNVDGDAQLSLPGILENIPVTRVYPEAWTIADGFVDNRQPVFRELHQTERRIPKAGWRQATLHIPAGAPAQKTQLMLGDVVLIPDVTLWEKPRLARIETPDTLTRPAPDSPGRLTPQPRRVMLSVDCVHSGWVRTHWGDRPVWHPETDVTWLPAEEAVSSLPPAPKLLKELTTRSNEHQWQWSHIPPVSVASDAPDTLTLRFENTNEQRILSLPRLCGYQLNAENNTVSMTLRALPGTPAETIILIDPGHGGAETGTAGPNGLAEKKLNLILATALKKRLSADGFQVHLTRTGDKAVSLDERIHLARQRQAHLVLSLHHNALPDGRDPATHQGACCFWYHPHARALAENLQTALSALPDVKNYGVFEESFALTRIPSATAVLIEVGFFTDPQEFARLIQPAFQAQVVNQLALTVSRYVGQSTPER